METIKEKQKRVIKSGLFYQKVYKNPEYNNNYLKTNLIGQIIKTDSDLQNCFFKKISGFNLSYEVHTKNKIFKLYSFELKTGFNTVPTYSFFLITVNDKVYYFNKSNIFAPASSAFDTLTECYFNGHTEQMSWKYISLYEAKFIYKSVSGFDSIVKTEITQQTNLIDILIDKLYYHY